MLNSNTYKNPLPLFPSKGGNAKIFLNLAFKHYNMRNIIFIPFSIILLTACMKGKSADLVVHNAIIHTMDNSDQVAEAMAIKDGKIIEVGPERQILNKYLAEQTLDAGGKEIYPGFTDAHGHLIAYADMKLGVSLFGSKSMEEIMVRTEKYADKSNRKFVVGHGWDQSIWQNDVLPNNEKLNEIFPDRAVCLYRVDGHAILANQKALDIAKITPETFLKGGKIEILNGKCTGILLDKAMDYMGKFIPTYPEKKRLEALYEIQEELLQYGVVGVHEAGIENRDLPLFKKLALSLEWELEVYGMLRDSKENREFAAKNGKVNWRNFYISSFKMFADGALGSRGALLKQPYSDDPHSHGIQTTSYPEMVELAEFCLKHDYQLNSHAIGDSSAAILLNLYKRAFEVKKDHRWRIEHAQVIDPKDFSLFADYGVFPSVQPTHAISDQRWAENRLGKERMKSAYAYQTILNQTGIIALGTDFPFDRINPFLTIFAATQRKNMENQPSKGFRKEDGLSLKDCMKGMTIWAAFAAFRENKSGSLEKGKEATFVILDRPLNQGPTFIENFANRTVVRGKIVYSVE
jgi:predicted amidohydrolase YtcJ